MLTKALSLVRDLFGLKDALLSFRKQMERSLGEVEYRTSVMGAEMRTLRNEIRMLRQTVGRMEERQTAGAATLREGEFQVFSQWGEDGIIQFLLRHTSIPCKTFVEFGVETYVEANTRWLLIRHGWSGLVIDGDEKNVAEIHSDAIYWRHNLKAIQAFITRENINDLISENGFSGEIGILSVDVDGVDYWIWEALTVVSPAIVIAEYNALFGPIDRVTVPYDADFMRNKAHYSGSYYGASIAALAALGDRKGYALVGCNSAGNNAFFVKRELMKMELRELTAAEAFVPSAFRETRDETGALIYPSFEEASALVKGLPLEEVDP